MGGISVDYYCLGKGDYFCDGVVARFERPSEGRWFVSRLLLVWAWGNSGVVAGRGIRYTRGEGL